MFAAAMAARCSSSLALAARNGLEVGLAGLAAFEMESEMLYPGADVIAGTAEAATVLQRAQSSIKTSGNTLLVKRPTWLRRERRAHACVAVAFAATIRGASDRFALFICRD